MRIIFSILIIWSTTSAILAQGIGIPLRNNSYHIYDRLEIMTRQESPLYSAIQPYRRGDVTAYAISIDTTFEGLTKKDKDDLYYIFKDNNEWLGQSYYPTTLTARKEPVYKEVHIDSTQTLYKKLPTQNVASIESPYYVKTKKNFLWIFYKTPANFFELNTKGFQFKLNPIFNLKYTKVKDGEDIFQNQRGIEARGTIDDRLYFYTNILETQASFPTMSTIGSIETMRSPEQGFINPTKVLF